MEGKTEKNLEIYTGWFSLWSLLGMFEREFFQSDDTITPEQREKMRERLEELREHLEHCEAEGLLRFDNTEKSGGFPAIMRGLSELEKQITQEAAAMTDKEWRNIEMKAIRLRIEAWAQRIEAKNIARKGETET